LKTNFLIFWLGDVLFMKLKKLLSGLLIGAFVFGITAGDVSAASKDKKNSTIQVIDNQKQPPQMKDGNKNQQQK